MMLQTIVDEADFVPWIAEKGLRANGGSGNVVLACRQWGG